MIGVGVGMPSSSALTSISQAVLVANWLAEGKLKTKFLNFWNNKPGLVLCSFYIMHLIGLLYTHNFDYGLEDINKKLPLLLFPLVFCSGLVFNEKEKTLILSFFIVSVTIVTLIGTTLLIRHQIVDIHDISPYIAPVRLAMMIILSLFMLWRYFLEKKLTLYSLIIVLLSVWLLIFLYIMQSLTAALILIIIAILLFANYGLIKLKKGRFMIGLFISLFLFFTLSALVIYPMNFYRYCFPIPDKINFTTLDRTTPRGNPYSNDSLDKFTENGHYVYVNVSWIELKNSWVKRSRIPYDSNDLKGNLVKFTLIRYLASKDLRKDEDGMNRLTKDDITAIENGIPDYRFNTFSGLKYRLYEFFFEINDYNRTHSINGYSVIMRLEYWKAAIQLILNHPFMGVGTGDVRQSLEQQYVTMHSRLSPGWRLRAHNQFLEIGVGFGFTGIAWFIFSLFYPPIKSKKLFTYSYFIFWAIFMLSLFTEDTLETEAGATFYGFFNSFFLFL
jgi:hypothetical protein